MYPTPTSFVVYDVSFLRWIINNNGNNSWWIFCHRCPINNESDNVLVVLTFKSRLKSS